METLSNDLPRRDTSKVHLFTYVLNYDDLREDRSRTFRATTPVIELGRGEETALILESKTTSALRFADLWLSSRHSEVQRIGDAAVLLDLGSKNGTFINGRRVDRHTLVDRDVIEIGHSLIVYRVVDESMARTFDDTAAHGTGTGGKSGVWLGPTQTFCPEVAALVGQLLRIAPSTVPVLIVAETGSGKEVVAQTIHRSSHRAGRLVDMDCGAVPESLFESTLFGHERGAFTGATESRIGDLVRADLGSVFLDEVGNMSAASQAKLLRVFESGRVTPLGASEPCSVNLRWIAATNRELAMDGGAFRSDLLHRLAGFVARLPPLRDRREDLGALVAHFLREAGVDWAGISVQAARVLFSFSFPGNIRQLRALVRSAVLLAGDGQIELAHLPELSAASEDVVAPPASNEPPPAMPKRKNVEQPSVAELESALTASRGNVLEAARNIGAHPRQLYRWIERIPIDLERFRRGS